MGERELGGEFDFEVDACPSTREGGRNESDADERFCLLWSRKQEPEASEIAHRIVERIEHASAFLKKTVTRAVVSVPSGSFVFLSSSLSSQPDLISLPRSSSTEWSFETLEHLRRDLPSVLPSNLKVFLHRHHTSALQLLPLPSPRWITKDSDTWTSNILVVDADKEWGNTTLSLLRMRNDGYDVMGVRSLIADPGSYEDEVETQVSSWKAEELGRKLDVLLRDVKVGKTRLSREDVDVVSSPRFPFFYFTRSKPRLLARDSTDRFIFFVFCTVQIVLTSSQHRNLNSLRTVLESAFVNSTKVKINHFDFASEEAIVRGAARLAMAREARESWGDICSITIDSIPFAIGLTNRDGQSFFIS